MGTCEGDPGMTGALREEADKDLALARQVGEALSQRGWTLATAESCTGGGMAALITEIPGCSHWFDRAWVTYSNHSKVTLLGVPEALIEAFGAVSEPVVCAMVEGALKFSRADIVVAVSGVAGPGGGTAHKPVGTVCLAWGERQGGVRTDTFWFPGDRQAIRAAAIARGLLGVWEWASKPALA